LEGCIGAAESKLEMEDITFILQVGVVYHAAEDITAYPSQLSGLA